MTPLPSPPLPPDLIAVLAVGAADEVAGGEVLDHHPVGLLHLDAVAPGAARPEVLIEVFLLQLGEPGRVPSMITLLRSMPRMWRSGVVTSTPAFGAPCSW